MCGRYGGVRRYGVVLACDRHPGHSGVASGQREGGVRVRQPEDDAGAENPKLLRGHGLEGRGCQVAEVGELPSGRGEVLHPFARRDEVGGLRLPGNREARHDQPLVLERGQKRLGSGERPLPVQ